MTPEGYNGHHIFHRKHEAVETIRPDLEFVGRELIWRQSILASLLRNAVFFSSFNSLRGIEWQEGYSFGASRFLQEFGNELESDQLGMA